MFTHKIEKHAEMTASEKILLLCWLSICISTKVDGLKTPIIRKSAEANEENYSENEGRGTIIDIMNAIRPSVNQQVPVNIPSSSFSPDAAVAPSFQVPSDIAVNQNKTLIRGLLNGIITGEQAVRSSYNKNWLNYALQSCSKVDPKSLTAVLPTSANGLRVPKMYYFQNDTSGALNWYKAQEWCTARGMSLLTVNDANENKVIIDILRLIMAGSTPTTDVAVFNPTSWLIGLNGFTPGGVPTWVGDGSSSFTDWHNVGVTEPTPTTNYCGIYNQARTVDNIRMDARDCAPATEIYRYICEVSDVCTALFMSRFPTSYFHHPNQGHIHYSPGGVLPPL